MISGKTMRLRSKGTRCHSQRRRRCQSYAANTRNFPGGTAIRGLRSSFPAQFRRNSHFARNPEPSTWEASRAASLLSSKRGGFRGNTESRRKDSHEPDSHPLSSASLAFAFNAFSRCISGR